MSFHGGLRQEHFEPSEEKEVQAKPPADEESASALNTVPPDSGAEEPHDTSL